MTFEGMLKQKLSTINEIGNKVYPLSVPEGVKAPYISYCLAGGDYLKCLDGDTPMRYDYEINILAKTYTEVNNTLEGDVKEVILSLMGQKCDDGMIRQIDLEMPTEQYEEAVKLQRANIRFSIYF